MIKKNKTLVVIFALIALFSCINLAHATEARDVALTREVLMEQDPDPAEPGKTLELRWKVTKEGGDPIKNLTYKLEPEYPFSLHPSYEKIKNVGWWRATGQDHHYTLYYKLLVDEDATEETHSIELKKRYDENKSWRTKEYDIRVGEKEEVNLQRGNIRSTPKQLRSDIEDIELDIEIQNIGNENAENVKMALQAPEYFEPSHTYSHETMLGTIPHGQSKVGTLYFDIDEKATAGLHEALLKVSYKEENENEYEEREFPVELNIKAKPKFEIVSAEPTEFRGGESGKVSITVENKGEKKAESVSVNAFKDIAQPFDFEDKSDYIGTLEPGEKGEAVITFEVENDAESKENILDIEIRGIDGDEVVVEQGQLNIGIEARERFDLDDIPVEIAIAIVAALILIGSGTYLLMRK